MRIAISGSTGLIGTALRGALDARGDVVIPLVRPSTRPKRPGVDWDPAAGTIDAPALEGVDAIVHLAGESIAGGPWTAGRRRRIRDSRLHGTTLLARTVAGLSIAPRVLISSSAIGFYGDRADEELTEDSDPGQGFLADTCVTWEAATLPTREAGIRVVLARTGLVLSRSGGVLRVMLPASKLGLGAVLGDGAQYMSWIALEDEVRALLHAIDREDLSGPVNLVGPDPVTNTTFTRTLGGVLRRPTFLRAPAAVLRLAMGEMAEQLLLASQRVLPKRLLASGFEFRHGSLEPTLRAVLGQDQK